MIAHLPEYGNCLNLHLLGLVRSRLQIFPMKYLHNAPFLGEISTDVGKMVGNLQVEIPRESKIQV